MVSCAQTSPFSPSTLVIHYNQNSTLSPPQIPTSQVLEPIKIQVPMPFPYKKNNEVLWNFTCSIHPNSNHDSTMTTPNYGLMSSITNISRVSGITHNGHYYNLKELEKWRVE